MQKQQLDAAPGIRVITLSKSDTRQTAIAAIGDQNTPVVLVFPDATFKTPWRPDDFRQFTLLRRERNLQILFVIPREGGLRSWASAHGFKDVTYPSLEAVEQALAHKGRAAPTAPPPTVTHPAAAGKRPGSAFSTTPLSPAPQFATTEEQQPAFTALAPASSLPPANVPANPGPAAYGAPPFAQPGSPGFSHLGAVPTVRPKRRRARVIVLVALALLIIAAATASTWLVLAAHTNGVPTNTAGRAADVGEVYFRCSGQFNQSNTTGCNDILVLELDHLSQPAAGKSAYAWLLGDPSASLVPALYLGKLSVGAQGQASLTYTDPHHTNLLGEFSRVLITEQDASVIPSTYSLDKSDWRYLGGISAAPNPQDTAHHYSLLAHIRHLLSDDPKLLSVGLHGGLDIWFYRNTEKLTEWTSAAAGYSHAPDFMHRMLVRILTYLDGITVVPQDLPNETDIASLVDPTQARVGLLEFNPTVDDPPGYIYHVGLHLASLVTSPGVTPRQVALANQIAQALSYVKQWLLQVRNDALQLIKLSSDQLLLPSAQALLNDMDAASHNAFDGTQPDPASGQVEQGSYWIHSQIQQLATLDMSVYVDR
jgi:hypothetical protein